MAKHVVTILKHLREGRIDLGEITVHQRRMCVRYLTLESYTHDEIAEIFSVHRQTILRDTRVNRKELARLVDEIDVKSTAGGLIAWAKALTAKAMKEKDYNLAWKIQRDLISDLQGLGYLPKSAEQHHVQIGTFVDLVGLAKECPDINVINPMLPEEMKLIPELKEETDDRTD